MVTSVLSMNFIATWTHEKSQLALQALNAGLASCCVSCPCEEDMGHLLPRSPFLRQQDKAKRAFAEVLYRVILRMA